MSNELEREIQLYNQFECDQRSSETQKLRELSKRSSLAAWAAMTRKQKIKSYLPVVVDEEELWSSEVVKAVYCDCTWEIERLRQVKSDEAFDAKLNLVSGSLLRQFILLTHSLGMRELRGEEGGLYAKHLD
jgi:hypothetical protein